MKPNAYLGTHEAAIVEISSRFEEAVWDSFDEEPVQVTPEDLYFTLGLVLDNGLPYDLVWPAYCIDAVADCFGLATGQLLDQDLSSLLGLKGKVNFYYWKFPGGKLWGPVCHPIKKI